MAIQQLRANSHGALPFVWDVSSPVGAGMRNERTDVMLVQHLLYLYRAFMMPGFRPPIGAVATPMDGTFDVATGYWIFAVQSRHHTLKSDGIISPLCGSRALTTRTIGVLNAAASLNAGALWESMDTDPSVQRDLRIALAKSVLTGGRK